jgi:hypothetical protein
MWSDLVVEREVGHDLLSELGSVADLALCDLPDFA